MAPMMAARKADALADTRAAGKVATSDGSLDSTQVVRKAELSVEALEVWRVEMTAERTAAPTADLTVFELAAVWAVSSADPMVGQTDPQKAAGLVGVWVIVSAVG